MELGRLIELLSDTDAYPVAAERVEVQQTHISAVFLVSSFVYKIKKPVRLGFLDFSTLDKRRHFCQEEVRLNRRLAADVYLGVVPVARHGDGLKIEGNGEVVEWAVKMKRLPADATLEEGVLRGQIDNSTMETLARQVAAFHAQAEASPAIAAFGKFETVAHNARENFAQTQQHVGATVTRRVWDRLRELTDAWLSKLQPLIDSRAARGVPRDTHGDLHLDHVYLLEADSLVIIDCIEFNERFRYADPVADMAFLAMDLRFHQRGDLAMVFAETYFQAANDGEGRALLPFYESYRAVVRAKVEGIAAGETEMPEDSRADARRRARAHWLLALQQLEAPGKRPALVLVGGLPGTGKSTLARALADRAGFHIIRSDEVRKELAGIGCAEATTARLDEKQYSDEWHERTYAECLRRAEQRIAEGQRVIVDGTFRQEKARQAFLRLAADMMTPALFLVCRATPEAVRTRLQQRRNDVSDADWNVYLKAAERWEPAKNSCEIWTDDRDAAIKAALAELAKHNLYT